MFRLQQLHLVTMISDQITGQGRNLTTTDSDLDIKSYLILSQIGGLSMHILRTDNNDDEAAALTFSP